MGEAVRLLNVLLAVTDLVLIAPALVHAGSRQVTVRLLGLLTLLAAVAEGSIQQIHRPITAATVLISVGLILLAASLPTPRP